MSAAEIAAETGISGRRVAGTIKRRLLIAYVERRRASIRGRCFYLYRRLRRVDATRRTLGSQQGPGANAAVAAVITSGT